MGTGLPCRGEQGSVRANKRHRKSKQMSQTGSRWDPRSGIGDEPTTFCIVCGWRRCVECTRTKGKMSKPACSPCEVNCISRGSPSTGDSTASHVHPWKRKMCASSAPTVESCVAQNWETWRDVPGMHSMASDRRASLWWLKQSGGSLSVMVQEVCGGHWLALAGISVILSAFTSWLQNGCQSF